MCGQRRTWTEQQELRAGAGGGSSKGYILIKISNIIHFIWEEVGCAQRGGGGGGTDKTY